jgi:hypothetical protein
VAQWLAEEAAMVAAERLQHEDDPAEDVTRARSEHERIMEAGRRGKLVK